MRALRIFLVVPFLIVQSFSINAQSFEEVNKENKKLVQAWVDKCNITGLAVAVYHKNRLIWNEEFGYSNLEYNIPVHEESKFRIASVSKSFTGSAILKLHLEGKLHLDDSISKYMDSIPDSWKTITIRQVAQHTSGIGHYIDEKDALDTHHYKTTQEAINKFKDRPLMNKPGEGRYYSSYAYTVLAAVIEKVTGQDFLTAMKAIIFDPLSMDNTTTDSQNSIVKNRTGFYQYDQDGKIENAPMVDLSGRYAGSGFLSTAIDLAKFGAAHTYSSSFFSQEDLELLTSPRKINDSTTTSEGLGWGKRKNLIDGDLVFWNNGRTPGSTCGLLVYPKENISIAIVSNVRGATIERGDFDALALRIIDAVGNNSIRPITSKDRKKYSFDINVANGSKYEGELNILEEDDNGNLGYFSFHNGLQTFTIVDAFWREDELWVYTLGDGADPIPAAYILVKIQENGSVISGEIPRIASKIEGKIIK